MRIPSGLVDVPVFLCIQQGDQYRMVGTAFFLNVKDSDYLYLVTARHCVEKAKAYGDLYIRMNKIEGGPQFVLIDSNWHFPGSVADDVAVLPVSITAMLRFNLQPIPLATWCVTDEVVEGEGIGVGDEVIAIGLFTHRDGWHRNRPIVRKRDYFSNAGCSTTRLTLLRFARLAA